MSHSPLFRPEVLAERGESWLGPVLLAPKVSHRGFAAAALAAAVAVFGLLFFGAVPRKVRVTGMLVPESGLVQVYPAQGGVITDVAVEEGRTVNKGDRLVVVSTDLESSTLGATAEQVARQLEMRKQSLLDDRRNAERLAEQQQHSLADRVAALEAEEKKLASEIQIQGARVHSAARTVARQRAMMKEGVASAENVQTAEEAHLEQTARLRELERGRMTAERQRAATQAELDELPIKTQRELASVDRNVASVDQQLAEIATRREIVISAPSQGVVTSLQAKRGARPDARVPLLAIVPKDAKLEAQLYCPSAAIGLLKVGQRVLLRYEAFPYQKFGHYEGTITTVSHAAIAPSELGSGVEGIVGAHDAVYHVTVALAEQSVRAYGKPVALQPGMKLEADVVLERRRLVEWMLEPLFTVSGGFGK